MSHFLSSKHVILIALILTGMIYSSIANDQNSTSNDMKVVLDAIVSDKGIIQFNGTLPNQGHGFYVINVSTVANENDTYCQHSFCEEYTHEPYFKIPSQDDFIIDHKATCIFQFDCTYNISVISKNENKFESSKVYHIPKCVNGRCGCRHRESLPIPRIKSTFHYFPTPYLDIEWEVDDDYMKKLPEDDNLDHLAINILELEKCKDHLWKNAYPSTEQLYDHKSFRLNGVFTRKNFNPNIECLRIEVNTVDIKHCHSRSAENTVFINKTAILPESVDNISSNFNLKYFLMSVLAILILIGIITLSLYGYVWWKKKKHILRYWHNIYNNPTHGSENSQAIPMRENPLYLMQDPHCESDLEIPPSAIKEIGKEIGKGAFGRVYVARVDMPGKISSGIVAIKKLKRQATPEQLEEFTSEIATMRRAGCHRNIVQLLGTCTVNRCLVMIMEFIPCGDLLKYLRAVRQKLSENSRHDSIGASSINNNNINHNNNNSNINFNGNNNNSNNLKNSTSSLILGPLGKYLDILHSHSTSSASDTSSYITQPDTVPSAFQIGSTQFNSRPSFVETMYTSLTVSSNPELSPMIPTLEYIVDNVELHNFALQIARGMKHLEEKQITHRDLAARNILIDEHKTLKISDFGLARDGIYVNSRNKKVPLRWLSIEAMKDNLYSSKSDVWSFAIVLWEIATLGGFPYPTVQNNELLNYLLSGNRLEKPEICSDMLYNLMLDCWKASKDERPNFHQICSELNKNRIYIDFNELSPTYVFPPTFESTCKP